MAVSARKSASRPHVFAAKGVSSSRLRQRKHALARKFGIPHELLGGSLKQVYRRCGKSTCRCASGEGHPMWTLTYSVDGLRHVEYLPEALVPEVTAYADLGKAYLAAVSEIQAINAQLLSLWRRQQKKPTRRGRGGSTDRRSGT